MARTIWQTMGAVGMAAAVGFTLAGCGQESETQSESAPVSEPASASVEATDSTSSEAQSGATATTAETSAGGATAAGGTGGASSSEMPSFNFESGQLRIQPFNPETFDGVLFDPCNDITAREFGEMGLPVPEPYRDGLGNDPGTYHSCWLPDVYPNVVVDIGARLSTRSVSEENEIPMPMFASEVLPEIYVTLTQTAMGGWLCNARVETERGELFSGALDVSNETLPEVLCQLPMQTLERLYSLQ